MDEKTTQEPVAATAATPRTATARPAKKGGLGKLLLLILSYAVVGAIVWQLTLRFQNDPARQQAKAEEAVKDLVKKVSALMIVPSVEEELPQVAVVDDAENLAKNQAFFAGVQNGDQILIYLKGQKAIIYRPSDNKIVNVGPVVAENATSTPQTTQKQVAPASTTPKATTTTNTTTNTDEEADEQ